MRPPPSLIEPQYRRYVAANFFALHGMWAQRTVVAWLAWELSGSASWVGVIAFLSFAPTFLSGPVFGVYADRADLRRAAMYVQYAMIVVGAALALMILSGALTIWGLACVALAQGVAISAHHPVRLALTPRLAPREALANAIAISSLNFNLARLLGPAAGGYAIAAWGAGWTTVGTVALYLPVIVVIAGLTPRPASGAPTAPVSVAAALSEGARFAWETPSVRAAMALTVVFATIVRGYLELLAVVADGAFERGAAGLGELMAAAGAGALTAALMLTARDWVTEPRVPRITVFAAFGGFAAAAGASASPVWAGALALTAVTGFCGTIVGVTMQSVVQLAVDDRRRGRVLSLWIMVGIGSAVIGALVMGVLADAVGLGPTMIGASTIGAGAVGYVRYQRWRIRRSNISRNRDLSALENGRPPPP
ncbi:MAG: MFS transporter [Pseudomonadota bacterium]